MSNRLKTLERVKGIEPSSSAWKAVALPLSYTRINAQSPLLGGPGVRLGDFLLSGGGGRSRFFCNRQALRRGDFDCKTGIFRGALTCELSVEGQLCSRP
jgi:hypothetical protein